MLFLVYLFKSVISVYTTSFQCGQQIKELKVQHEEDLKKVDGQIKEEQKVCLV